jgi:thymidine kinase
MINQIANYDSIVYKMAKLYFYYAAMNAGKSTTLLQSSYNYRERGMETLLFSPSIDTRFGHGKVASRIGLESNAISFDNAFDFFHSIDHHAKNMSRLSCIFVDEAQFLSKNQVMHLSRVVDELDLPVLTYGLRTDFMGETFEGSKYLLAWADKLIEIKTICHCGRKAVMNARMDKNGHILSEGSQIEIGGNERYVSLCRKHYFQGLLSKKC